MTEADLQGAALTDCHRYRALAAALRRLRRSPFPLDKFREKTWVSLSADDIAYEGANTSFQVHLKTKPARFATFYNAAQIATAPALAVAANSPLFLGRRLWDETRVALFRQSVDDRLAAGADDWRPARVSFGHGWVGATRSSCSRRASPCTRRCCRSSPRGPGGRGRGRRTPEPARAAPPPGHRLALEPAVYDGAGGGHVRVEMRALPRGPGEGHVANTAFLVGLVLAGAGTSETCCAGSPSDRRGATSTGGRPGSTPSFCGRTKWAGGRVRRPFAR